MNRGFLWVIPDDGSARRYTHELTIAQCSNTHLVCLGGARAIPGCSASLWPKNLYPSRSIFDRDNIVNEKDQREAMQKTQSYLITAAEEERKRQPQEITRRVQ